MGSQTNTRAQRQRIPLKTPRARKCVAPSPSTEIGHALKNRPCKGDSPQFLKRLFAAARPNLRGTHQSSAEEGQGSRFGHGRHNQIDVTRNHLQRVRLADRGCRKNEIGRVEAADIAAKQRISPGVAGFGRKLMAVFAAIFMPRSPIFVNKSVPGVWKLKSGLTRLDAVTALPWSAACHSDRRQPSPPILARQRSKRPRWAGPGC